MPQAVKWAYPDSSTTPPLIAVMLDKFIKQYLKLQLLTYKMAIIVPNSAIWLILLQLIG